MSFWIRPAREEDMDEIVALNDLAFGGKEEGRIVRELAKSGESLLSLVASDDNIIAGQSRKDAEHRTCSGKSQHGAALCSSHAVVPRPSTPRGAAIGMTR